MGCILSHKSFWAQTAHNPIFQVHAVNGFEVNNLRDLVSAVESATGPYIRFDLDYNQVRVKLSVYIARLTGTFGPVESVL